MRHPLPLILSLLMLAGCSNSMQEARMEDEFATRINTSSDMLEIDAQLDTLDVETQTLEDSYNTIQKNVLIHTRFDQSDVDETNGISIYINDNNILIVNEKAMSRNDFANFLAKYLPALCSPNPKLSIHKKANYDTAAWVLEMLYSHGCTNVDVE